MNFTTIRLVLAGAVALVLFMLLAVIAIAVARGTDINSSQLISLLSVVGTLVALLATLLGVNHVGGQLSDVKGLVNGHLQAHIGHSDTEIQALIDQRLSKYGVAPQAVIDAGNGTNHAPEPK